MALIDAWLSGCLLPERGRYALRRRMTEMDRNPSLEEELLEQLREECDRVTTRSEVLRALADEWIVATRLVSMYKDLFSDSERLKVLNPIAGPLLRLTQDVLWEYLLLRMARFADTPRAGRDQEKESLSVHWLPLLFEGDEEEDKQQEELKALVDEAVRAIEFARPWRNQHVAHVDLGRARDAATAFLGDKRPAVASPLQPATLEEMERALEAVHRALNKAFQFHDGREVGIGLEPADIAWEIGAEVFDRTIRLVEAVQFVDMLVASERGDPLDPKSACAFLEKLGQRNEVTYQRLAELRDVARLFPFYRVSAASVKVVSTGPNRTSGLGGLAPLGGLDPLGVAE